MGGRRVIGWDIFMNGKGWTVSIAYRLDQHLRRSRFEVSKSYLAFSLPHRFQLLLFSGLVSHYKL